MCGFEYTLSFFFLFDATNEKWSLQNKMENIGFEEDIPLINQDEDYDDYKTPDARRIDAETSFTVPATTEATSTLRLRQHLK